MQGPIATFPTPVPSTATFPTPVPSASSAPVTVVTPVRYPKSFLRNGWDLLRIKRRQIEIVKSMGYNVDDENGILVNVGNSQGFFSWKATTARFLDKYYPISQRHNVPIRLTLNSVYEHSSGNGQRMYAFYARPNQEGTSLHTESPKQFTDDIKRYANVRRPIQRALFISKNTVGAQAQHLIDALTAVNTLVLKDENMLYSPTEHVLYDPHQAMTPEETTRFLREANLTPGLMPVIRNSDPIVSNFGWPPGTLIKIFRTNTFTETVAKRSVYYRIVEQARNKS